MSRPRALAAGTSPDRSDPLGVVDAASRVLDPLAAWPLDNPRARRDRAERLRPTRAAGGHAARKRTGLSPGVTFPQASLETNSARAELTVMVAPLAVARIALPIPVHELFDYRIPDAMAPRLTPGVRVRVPVGNSFRVGFCVECVGESAHEDLKPIDAVLDDEPLLDDELLDFVRWTASYYYASVGEAIDCAVPKGTRKKERTIRWARIAESLLPPEQERGTGREKREAIRTLLTEEGAQPVEAILARIDVTEAPLRTLEKRGVIEFFDAPAPRPSFDESSPPPEADSPPRLSSDQLRAVAEIDGALDREEFECFLLHGVTGSGKTEVYLHAIASTVERGRGALILVPEIALTPQTVRRFRARLGEVAVLHSLLPAGERAEQYRRLRRGEVRVAIGARSAIFAPIPDLGIIVVDESHESSYKQENSPRYHARDLAVLRAMRRSIPCVLGTATPSLETYHNAKTGRYTYLELPERVTAHSLPEIEVIDLSKDEERTGGPLSRRLERCLAETLEGDGQVLLFLNRRGFARQVFCGSCGYSFECQACDIPLTYHKRQDRALCHYCGTVERIPPKCPECDFPGLGRRRDGTERIEETLAERFPGVVIDRLDRDTATSATRLEAILDRFRRGETRILVGTQMVAKGHDIPGVTLVGVLDADIALQQPDFRAAERTAQLLCQVAGRAGRGDKPGRVLIQTRQPEHYAIRAGVAQDLTPVYEEELPTRELLAYPPFGHLVRIVCEDAIDDRAIESAHELARRFQLGEGARLLGPAPAPMAKLRGRYRYHLLIKSASRAGLHATLRSTDALRARWSTTRVTVDVDPQSIV